MATRAGCGEVGGVHFQGQFLQWLLVLLLLFNFSLRRLRKQKNISTSGFDEVQGRSR